MSEFDKVKYNADYNKENYANIQFKIRKDEKQGLLNLAKQRGYGTISAYAKALLEAALADNSNPDSCRGGAEID